MTTHTLTDGDRLLRACALHPAEDTPRLAYADWLEENGQGERAAFVRVQCELARREGCRRCKTYTVAGRAYNMAAPDRSCPTCDALRRRERELFTFDNIGRWFREQGVPCERFTTDPALLENLRETAANVGITACLVSRGLLHRVVVPTAAALVGGPCPACGTLEYMPLEDGGGGRTCSACEGTGRTPGLAATLGRLMGSWETCGTCKGKGSTSGAKFANTSLHCTDCEEDTPDYGKVGTGLAWVPGGVLGCVRAVGVADREPTEWTSEDNGPSYVWTVRTPNQYETPGDIPRELFDLLAGGTLNMGNWVRRYDTPDLARSALGKAGAVLCRLATREK